MVKDSNIVPRQPFHFLAGVLWRGLATLLANLSKLTFSFRDINSNEKKLPAHSPVGALDKNAMSKIFYSRKLLA